VCGRPSAKTCVRGTISSSFICPQTGGTISSIVGLPVKEVSHIFVELKWRPLMLKSIEHHEHVAYWLQPWS